MEQAFVPQQPPTYAYSEELQGSWSGRSWINWMSLFAYVVNVVVTYLSLTGIFGETNTALSSKYQTLVTPAGYAFAIWAFIFIGEGIWAVRQICFPVGGGVQLVAPWWWATCFFQCAWTVVFAQELIPLALIMMVLILFSLAGAVVALDQFDFADGLCDYLFLRAPFALHLGWILAASAVNVNVVFDFHMAPPSTLLNVAIVSIVTVVLVSGLAVSCLMQTAEPIIGFVAAWALVAIGVELGDPTNLNNPDRFNPYTWPQETLDAVQLGANIAAGIALGFALVGIVRRYCGCCC